MFVSIYALTDASGEVRYVGRTSRPVNLRFRQHINSAKRGGSSQKWCHAWIKTTLDQGEMPGVFVLEEISEDCDVARWAEAERKWIAHYLPSGRLTNLTSGGEQYPGFTLSEEHRRRISAGRLASATARSASQKNVLIAQKSSHNWTPERRAEMSVKLTGQVRSAEFSEKMSKLHKGRVKSEAERQAISERQLGTKQSAEWVEKRMIAQRGKARSEETKAKIRAGVLAYLARQDELSKV